MEQGLALDELLGMQTNLEREAQEGSGGEQSPPTSGAAERDAVSHNRRNPPMVKAWLRGGRMMLLRKLGSATAAIVL